MKFILVLFLSYYSLYSSLCGASAGSESSSIFSTPCVPSGIIQQGVQITSSITVQGSNVVINLQKVILRLEKNLKLQKKLLIQVKEYETKTDRQMQLFVDIYVREKNIGH